MSLIIKNKSFRFKLFVLLLLCMVSSAYAECVLFINASKYTITYSQTKQHNFGTPSVYSNEPSLANEDISLANNSSGYSGMLFSKQQQLLCSNPSDSFNYSHGKWYYDLSVQSVTDNSVNQIANVGIHYDLRHLYRQGYSEVNWGTSSSYNSNLNTAVTIWTGGMNYREYGRYYDYVYYLTDSGISPSTSDIAKYNLTKQLILQHQYIGYYPEGCQGSQCKCIQDIDSGDIWEANGNNKNGSWADWCSADPKNPGYDINCSSAIGSSGAANGSNGGVELAQINTNSSGYCGILGGWHLPTASKNIVVNTNITRYTTHNIGNLAAMILSNNYVSGNNLGLWMNNNGFIEVNIDPVTAPYWLSNSSLNGSSFGINMSTGNIMSNSQNLGYGVMLVHENN